MLTLTIPIRVLWSKVPHDIDGSNFFFIVNEYILIYTELIAYPAWAAR